MALILNKIELIQSIVTMVAVDTTIMDEFFSIEKFSKSTTIEYDASTAEGIAPKYSSFRQKADIVKKYGFDTVKLNPVNFNQSISKSALDANIKQFGENVYGESAGMVDAMQVSLLNGISKLELNTQVGKKAIMYEALITHKIVGGFLGQNGAEDIIFNVPNINKEVLSNTGSNLYWTNTSATPLTNISRVYRSMKVKPSGIIMNDNTYSLFLASLEVTTLGNTSTGDIQTFYPNLDANSSTEGFNAGTIRFKGMIIDIWVEPQTRLLASGTRTSFMADNYVVFASKSGEIYYGGIPVAQNGTVENITAPFDIQEVQETNPPVHEIVYRSAPLPVLKNGEEYYSLKVA